ncbi:MAG: hypothetical protein ACO2ZM_01125 [Francisellaceae bacterium]
MQTIRIVTFILITALLAACTQKSFTTLPGANLDAPPPAPGYYNPHAQPQGLSNDSSPVFEEHFYWKQHHDNGVVAPDSED